MAHEGLFATSNEIIAKAGAYNTTDMIEARINELCLQAESLINVKTQYNWSDKFSAPATTTLNADVWYILSDAESNLVAMFMIQNDMSGYTSQSEAQTMLDVLRDAFNRDINLLKDDKYRTFMIKA